MDFRELNQMSLEDERNHWWIRTRFYHMSKAVRTAITRFGQIRALEIGCGTAQNLHFLRTNPQLSPCIGHLVGIDSALSDNSVRFDWMTSADSLLTSPCNEVPESYELLIGMDVLEHIEDHVQALKEWTSYLVPGGYVFIAVPAFQALWSDHDEKLLHKRRYTRKSLTDAATEAGLQTIETYYIFSALAPAVYFLRKVLSRKTTAKGESTDLQRTLWPVNMLLTILGRVEYLMGGSSRIGTSVVGIFQKPSQDYEQ